jgi:hypothetical protein
MSRLRFCRQVGIPHIPFAQVADGQGMVEDVIIDISKRNNSGILEEANSEDVWSLISAVEFSDLPSQSLMKVYLKVYQEKAIWRLYKSLEDLDTV